MSKLTYEDRFYQALSHLCQSDDITYKLCYNWLHTDCDDLQEVILETNIVDRLWWVQGIAIIDAAHAIAKSPEEGRHNEIDYREV